MISNKILNDFESKFQFGIRGLFGWPKKEYLLWAGAQSILDTSCPGGYTHDNDERFLMIFEEFCRGTGI